jgi:hypothetical protein
MKVTLIIRKKPQCLSCCYVSSSTYGVVSCWRKVKGGYRDKGTLVKWPHSNIVSNILLEFTVSFSFSWLPYLCNYKMFVFYPYVFFGVIQNNHNIIKFSNSGHFLTGVVRTLNSICYSGRKEKWSLCPFLKVWTVYFLLQSGQVIWYTQIPQYFSSLPVGCLGLKWCWTGLLFLCSIRSSVCTQCLVIWLVSLTRMLTVARFCSRFALFTWLFSCFVPCCIVFLNLLSYFNGRNSLHNMFWILMFNFFGSRIQLTSIHRPKDKFDYNIYIYIEYQHLPTWLLHSLLAIRMKIIMPL